MALRTARNPETRLSQLWNRPIEWGHGAVLRLLDWFNQERWTNLLTILAIVLANLVILQFLLQAQDNRAIAFTILALAAPLAFLIPEISAVLFVVSGAGLFVNAMYFAAGPGGGTGERVMILLFFGLITLRALYEYVRTPREERPRLWTWFTALLILFWVYYMVHVAYIYLFRYWEVPPDEKMAPLGMYRPGIFRYFDMHMIWIGILPLIIILRDYQRAKRVLIALGVIAFLGVITVVWEYFAPLPQFWKVVFQIKDATETIAGYRIREPTSMHLFVAYFFVAVYAIGYLRGWRSAAAMVYIALALYAVLATKNRILWAGMAVFLPLAFLLKPPSVLMRQLWMWGSAILVFGALMFHPGFYGAVMQKVNEAAKRWQRNYEFAGDPRLDPSYQWRLRERDLWEIKFAQLTPAQQLFGAGLEEPYGMYVSLYQAGYGPIYKNTYFEKTHMHFSWLARLLHIGWIGTALMALLIVGALLRALQAFIAVPDVFTRAILVGVAGATITLCAYDTIHSDTIASNSAFPVVALWSVAEVALHWRRTGQIKASEAPASP